MIEIFEFFKDVYAELSPYINTKYFSTEGDVVRVVILIGLRYQNFTKMVSNEQSYKMVKCNSNLCPKKPSKQKVLTIMRIFNFEYFTTFLDIDHFSKIFGYVNAMSTGLSKYLLLKIFSFFRIKCERMYFCQGQSESFRSLSNFWQSLVQDFSPNLVLLMLILCSPNCSI